MSKYLKMADVFKGELFIDSDCDDVIVDDLSLTVLESFSGSDAAKFALHAINSHDELVASMQHYKKEAERWEVRATKEASRVQDLEAEVERLRARVSELEEFTHHFCDNSYNVDLGGGDCTATTCEAKEMAHKLDNRAWPDLWPEH